MGFLSWRWAPAVALVGGATIVSIAASVFIPRSIGQSETTRALSPASTERREDMARASAEDAQAAVLSPRAPRREKGASATARAAGVEAFFPPDSAELPPPLPDDPAPAEPVNTGETRDAFGPGAAPPSVPPRLE